MWAKAAANILQVQWQQPPCSSRYRPPALSKSSRHRRMPPWRSPTPSNPAQGKIFLKVLGRDAEDIMASGDEVADRESRERFVGAYDARHNVIIEGEKAFLIVGTDDFPLPIPLTRQKAGWKFDTVAGRLEILYRRIGRNELDAIQTC